MRYIFVLCVAYWPWNSLRGKRGQAAAVGKSKLITCKVNGQSADARQLSRKAHIPTVWAVDPKRLYREVIQDISVSFTIWDTFGDHTNDRCFAYAGADAILICYSAISRRSLKNAEKFWFEEVRKYSNRAVILLIACKTDLRSLAYRIYMNGDEVWENLPMQLKSLKPEDVVLPLEGRNVAKRINAFYYETDILDRRGVDETFTNALKACLISKRKYSTTSNSPFSSWINPTMPQFPMDSIRPSIQLPLLPRKPNLDLHKYDVRSTYEEDIKKLLNDETFYQFFDCILTVRLEDGGAFDTKTHRIVLSSASDYFRDVFSQNEFISNSFVAELIVPDRDKDQDLLRIVLNCSKIFVIKLVQLIYNGRLELDFQDQEDFDLLLKSLDICATVQDATFLEIDQEKFRARLLALGLNNEACESSCLFGHGLDIIGESQQRFRVYKPILMARCEAINVMMNNEFIEKKENRVNLPDISAVVLTLFISYCFTNKIDQLIDYNNLEICDFLEALEFASRFCLPSFGQQIQTALINRLNSMPDQECCLIIVSQIICLAKLLNLECILHWCLIHLCCHKKDDSWFDLLDEEHSDYVDNHCWPPKWYSDELRAYYLEMANSERSFANKQAKAFSSRNEDLCCSHFGQFLFNFVRFGK